jgi:asparagine synthase (glutamine-hydrolysing)
MTGPVAALKSRPRTVELTSRMPEEAQNRNGRKPAGAVTKRVTSRVRWERVKRSKPEIARVVESVRSQHLSYLERDALVDLADAAEDLDRDGIEGMILEAGTARGGSALVLAAAKSAGRPLYLYDTFGMIPPPSERDSADVHERYEVIASGQAEGPEGSDYYGYEENLLGQIEETFTAHGYPPAEHAVHFVRGLYEDTLHPEGPVALAHVDSDWYESVTTCLERVVPRLSVGGRIVIDDYGTWSGARDAVDEYFADGREGFEFEGRSRLHLVRTSAQPA